MWEMSCGAQHQGSLWPPEPDAPEVSPMCGRLLWWGWFPAGTQAGQASQHGWLCNLSGPDCYKSHDCWWAVPAPAANMWERQFQHGAHQLRHHKNGCHQHLSSAGNPSCLPSPSKALHEKSLGLTQRAVKRCLCAGTGSKDAFGHTL